MGAHFVLTTFGSLGDLHPYIAVGRGLSARGHRVTIATSEVYRLKVEGEGLDFHPLRPDLSGLLNDPSAMSRAFHPRTGSEYILRKVFLPHLEASYEDTLPVARRADLLVSHPIAFATPIAAETLKKRWISVILQPSLLISAYDPPSISGLPALDAFRGCGPAFWRLLFLLVKRVARRWGSPVNELRRKLALPDVGDPIFDDMFSPWGNQAWFSKLMATRRPDWPQQLDVTGYAFYDRLEPGGGLSPALRRFLENGPPPVVFTLGSSAVLDAGGFYRESAEGAERAGRRAVLLIGKDMRNLPQSPLPETIFVAEYAPFSELLPAAAATVHQGGSGTTAQALASGRPMIVVPWSHDQPDNARRVVNLGVARTIPRRSYKADRVAAELNVLLGDACYNRAAEKAAAALAQEDGVSAACDLLEAALR